MRSNLFKSGFALAALCFGIVTMPSQAQTTINFDSLGNLAAIPNC